MRAATMNHSMSCIQARFFRATPDTSICQQELLALNAPLPPCGFFLPASQRNVHGSKGKSEIARHEDKRSGREGIKAATTTTARAERITLKPEFYRNPPSGAKSRPRRVRVVEKNNAKKRNNHTYVEEGEGGQRRVVGRGLCHHFSLPRA